MTDSTDILDDFAALLADYEDFWHRWPFDLEELVRPNPQREIEHDALTIRAKAVTARAAAVIAQSGKIR